jgi:hypothetical protein
VGFDRMKMSVIKKQLGSLLTGKGVAMSGARIFYVPVGYYLRGFELQSSSGGFNVEQFVMPLAACPHFFWISDRLHPKVGGWDENKIDELSSTILNEMDTEFGQAIDGASFLRYLKLCDRPDDRGFPQNFSMGVPSARLLWGIGHLHNGELELSQRELKDYLAWANTIIDERSNKPGDLIWCERVKNVRTIIQLIDVEPSGIPIHCSKVAQLALRSQKLEKYWTNDEFW